MFLIVLHHSAFHGYWKGDSSQWLMGILFTAINFWHVDCFIAISGWFGIKFSWRKFLNVWGLIVFYSGVSLVVSLVMGWKISLGSIISAGWFGGCYLMLMLISPLLNAAVDYLYSQGKGVLIKAWGLMMFGVVMNWLPLHGLSGISYQGSFSLMLMLVVYVSARAMRKLELNIPESSCIYIVLGCLIGFLVTSIIPTIALVCLGKSVSTGALIRFTSYDAPHVIAMALTVLYLFVHYVKIPNKLSKIVTVCSPAMFGIYLLHEVTSFGRKLYTIPEQWLSSYTNIHPCFIVLISAVLVFFGCLVIEIVRRLVVGRVRFLVSVSRGA